MEREWKENGKRMERLGSRKCKIKEEDKQKGW
jgi:hypothetical protein